MTLEIVWRFLFVCLSVFLNVTLLFGIVYTFWFKNYFCNFSVGIGPEGLAGNMCPGAAAGSGFSHAQWHWRGRHRQLHHISNLIVHNKHLDPQHMWTSVSRGLISYKYGYLIAA